MKKKLLAIVLSATMVLSLAACGNAKTETKVAEPEKETATDVTDEEPETAEEAEEPETTEEPEEVDVTTLTADNIDKYYGFKYATTAPDSMAAFSIDQTGEGMTYIHASSFPVKLTEENTNLLDFETNIEYQYDDHSDGGDLVCTGKDNHDVFYDTSQRFLFKYLSWKDPDPDNLEYISCGVPSMFTISTFPADSLNNSIISFREIPDGNYTWVDEGYGSWCVRYENRDALSEIIKNIPIECEGEGHERGYIEYGEYNYTVYKLLAPYESRDIMDDSSYDEIIVTNDSDQWTAPENCEITKFRFRIPEHMTDWSSEENAYVDVEYNPDIKIVIANSITGESKLTDVVAANAPTSGTLDKDGDIVLTWLTESGNTVDITFDHENEYPIAFTVTAAEK